MTKTRRTAQQWQQLISDWQRGGQSVAEFCHTQNLTPSSFYLWRKRLNNEEVENALSPWVALSPKLGAGGGVDNDWELELSLPGGVILRMKQGQ